MNQVTIMRGLPGSLKTTWVNGGGKNPLARTNISRDDMVISADDFFMVGGTYRFRPEAISEAHTSCFRLFLKALADKVSHIIVDNTNTSLWECSPYYLAAQVAAYDVRFVRMYSDPVKAFRRNCHGVPLKAVLAMHERFESALPWWKETVLDTEAVL